MALFRISTFLAKTQDFPFVLTRHVPFISATAGLIVQLIDGFIL